VTYKGI